MLAAGTGVAPMIQLIKEVLDNEEDETLLQLVYACRTYDDLLMKDFLEEMKAYWNFTVLYALSRVREKPLPRKPIPSQSWTRSAQINRHVMSCHLVVF